MAPIVGYWPGTVALGTYFDLLIRRRLVLNVFPFPVSKAKLIGEVYNNRRSAANRCPRFVYPFVFLMLRQYFWCCDSYSANRRSTANMKNPRKSYYLRCKFAAFCLLAQRRRPASLLSAGINVAPITFYIAPIQLALHRS